MIKASILDYNPMCHHFSPFQMVDTLKLKQWARQMISHTTELCGTTLASFMDILYNYDMPFMGSKKLCSTLLSAYMAYFGPQKVP